MYLIHWMIIVLVVLFISVIAGLSLISTLDNNIDANQYCAERDKVSVRITGNTYICVDPEDKV